MNFLIQVIAKHGPVEGWLLMLASSQNDYVVADDNGAAIRFLMRSGEIAWNPASAAGRSK